MIVLPLRSFFFLSFCMFHNILLKANILYRTAELRSIVFIPGNGHTFLSSKIRGGEPWGVHLIRNLAGFEMYCCYITLSAPEDPKSSNDTFRIVYQMGVFNVCSPSVFSLTLKLCLKESPLLQVACYLKPVSLAEGNGAFSVIVLNLSLRQEPCSLIS